MKRTAFLFTIVLALLTVTGSVSPQSRPGKGKNGQAVLTMTGITVDKVPDGRVYLAKNLDYSGGVELGKLTRFTGTVTFAIPASVDLAKYDSVVIWCKKFDVGIGQAKLH